MNKTLKAVGLLLLGAILGQVLMFGAALFHAYSKVKDPNFLLQTTMFGTDFRSMNEDEGRVWNDMREKIRSGKHEEVNHLIEINEGEWDVKVIPAKPVFNQTDKVLAVIQFKNTSPHTLHVNEPRVQRLTQEIYNYQDLNQLDYDISISPLESTWMRTLLPGQELSVPILIPVTKAGQYKINYYLSCFQFNQSSNQSKEGLIGSAPTIKQVTCSFSIE